jgi:hypothetical protein
MPAAFSSKIAVRGGRIGKPGEIQKPLVRREN